MKLIDADILPRHGNRGGLVRWSDIEEAPTVDAVEVIKKMLEDATEAFFEKNEHLIDKWVRGATEDEVEDASTVDAVKATMPWTNPDGTETMLDEVSYEIGYAQGQKDTKRQGCKGCKHWIYKSNFGEDCEFDTLENCKCEPKDGR